MGTGKGNSMEAELGKENIPPQQLSPNPRRTSQVNREAEDNLRELDELNGVTRMAQ